MWSRRTCAYTVLFIGIAIALSVTISLVVLRRGGGNAGIKDEEHDRSSMDEEDSTPIPSPFVFSTLSTVPSFGPIDAVLSFSPTSQRVEATIKPFPTRVTSSPVLLPRPALITSEPTQSFAPSLLPTNVFEEQPTVLPTGSQTQLTDFPTRVAITPSTQTTKPTNSALPRTTFYAVADAPYNVFQAVELDQQVVSLPADAEFLVHLGDIRSASSSRKDGCALSEYEEVAKLLKKSPVPVFIVVGDNEYNDCPDINSAWSNWNNTFTGFEDHWDHNLSVVRPSERKESFAFVHKQTLFIGLNLVGGAVHNTSEWTMRLTEQAMWTKKMIRNHTRGDTGDARAIAIFGHANPSENHRPFFVPLQRFIRNELDPSISILYMNGDAHVWRYQPNFFGQENFLRIQLTGGTSEKPLKVVVDPGTEVRDTSELFQYDRRLQE